jgi:hypothetical protein
MYSSELVNFNDRLKAYLNKGGGERQSLEAIYAIVGTITRKGKGILYSTEKERQENPTLHTKYACMKVTCLTLILFLIACELNAQSTQKSDSLYIVTYTTGPSWDANKKPSEQAYFKEHSANLSKWRKEGIIQLGARYSDKGIIILKAPSLLVAKELVLRDEGVLYKLFEADIQKFNVFYPGCTN